MFLLSINRPYTLQTLKFFNLIYDYTTYKNIKIMYFFEIGAYMKLLRIYTLQFNVNYEFQSTIEKMNK